MNVHPRVVLLAQNSYNNNNIVVVKTPEDEIKTRVAKVNVYGTVLVAHLLKELLNGSCFFICLNLGVT